ncbi:helix-turn-helix domain-containing protein [Pseudomonas gingeri]|uniref:Helix-turn-helix transcriptional regulator n=1 Tax=Pseudomonas gingeri TaxID=117681 RepID=A0A7Y8CNA6_9PSED|nr:helix-turn-helix domain-containing protein [Pseudomonas gingeri]NWB31297.1 helix-turn-helix transcriptional regulator [Pseudomonas gingeri]NWC35839.1 helix-turn-helix transcriptional regulator [Pseudomonas gingeri]NWD06282.1 helix-turn-helix transcriptional regulator [Pseudomonas gingeri]NWD49325.1 helix-turn-helix transcriptional regulator [Pseudomonas gingeri]NWE26802.1 helix-turn-helix transcriptional regulator [Pseudomonas gingeri]
MSLKTAFAAVLKAMRATRGLSQKSLAEVSSRTYISKLERGQCCPTLEMISALSVPLNVSPLTLMAVTLGAETGQSIKMLASRMEREAAELAESGVLKKLQIPFNEEPSMPVRRAQPRSRNPERTVQQTEFCFAE